ncbi:MAG: peptidase M14 [Acidobacteria bacterium]|nr:MAG: peptidase M14 [Acidobacteriota bacterium]
MMKARRVLWVLTLCLLSTLVRAETPQFYPGVSYDPAIPTLKQVVGHDWGEHITSYEEMVRYLTALADASSRVKLVEYGRTWEGRALYYLIIASEENMARLDEIRRGMQKLADPRRLSAEDAERLIGSLPVIVWLAYGVHGNEISSTDAALLTAYHLVAAKDDPVAEMALRQSVIIIDPSQNPDGRNRFVNYYRQTRGRWPDADPQSAEHNEVWPGGRTNHYLFDMNRDWFALTQPETRGRVKAYLEWYPQVFVDFHEMGSNATYYFAPPAPPLNPEETPAQAEWHERFGKNNAKWFDRMKFDYFTREVFDSFYPGYGEGWPMFHGSIGMTYEQASARGLRVKRDDETMLAYRDGVQHHFISSLSTIETAATHREALLRYYYEFRQSAIQEGEQGKIKEYIIAPGGDPNRAAKLVALLMRQGIEVKRATAPFSNPKVRDYYEGRRQSKQFPAGTYVISLAQPAKRLINTLLAKQTPMDEAFIKEQLRRHKKRLGDQIYDITGWSLPLLFDVDAYMAEEASRGEFTVLQEPPSPQGALHGGEASVAYLIPWGTQSAAKALAALWRQDIRVFSSDKPFTLNGVKFPRGSLIIKVKNNPSDLHDRLAKLATEVGVDIYATDTSWVEEGANFGSNQVHYLKKPRVAMAYNLPTHPYSVGWARYLLEQVYGYPVTLIHAQQLRRADLSKYDVLILPNSLRFFGGYEQVLGEATARRLKQWVQNGGTLITIGEATRWLTDEKVGLLATKRELKGGRPEKEEKPSPSKETTGAKKPSGQPSPPSAPSTFSLEEAIQPEKELPPATPGAIMRITLDTEHWLAFGYDGDANVLVHSRNIFTPLKLDKGRNIGVYMSEDKLLLSGFTWDEARRQLAHKAYLMVQPHGRGYVVAFAEDPNFRAFCDGLNLLFLNAVFFGPAH